MNQSADTLLSDSAKREETYTHMRACTNTHTQRKSQGLHTFPFSWNLICTLLNSQNMKNIKAKNSLSCTCKLSGKSVLFPNNKLTKNKKKNW